MIPSGANTHNVIIVYRDDDAITMYQATLNSCDPTQDKLMAYGLRFFGKSFSLSCRLNRISDFPI